MECSTGILYGTPNPYQYKIEKVGTTFNLLRRVRYASWIPWEIIASSSGGNYFQISGFPDEFMATPTGLYYLTYSSELRWGN